MNYHKTHRKKQFLAMFLTTMRLTKVRGRLCAVKQKSPAEFYLLLR